MSEDQETTGATDEAVGGAVKRSVEGGAQSADSKGKSTVSFPYDHLGSAIDVARVIRDEYGNRCLMDQLAGHYGAKTTSGAFRNKVTSARIFGLIEVSRKGITLTGLGDRILVDRTEQQAKVEAFLNVPLYRQLYEGFKGRTLPANKAGLESAILDAGVAPKQVATARWRFQSSAELAGFFKHGNDRLVLPPMISGEEGPSDKGESDEQGANGSGSNGSDQVTPAANLRSVTLRSGGKVTLGLTVDLFSLDETDQAFVLDLVKKVREYGEQKALPAASSEPSDESSNTSVGFD